MIRLMSVSFAVAGCRHSPGNSDKEVRAQCGDVAADSMLASCGTPVKLDSALQSVYGENSVRFGQALGERGLVATLARRVLPRARRQDEYGRRPRMVRQSLLQVHLEEQLNANAFLDFLKLLPHRLVFWVVLILLKGSFPSGQAVELPVTD